MKIKDEIVQKLVDNIVDRSTIGIDKYGVTLQDSPQNKEEFLQHLKEELMDAALYVEKLQQLWKQLN